VKFLFRWTPGGAALVVLAIAIAANTTGRRRGEETSQIIIFIRVSDITVIVVTVAIAIHD
jgi:hypothetical protein